MIFNGDVRFSTTISMTIYVLYVEYFFLPGTFTLGRQVFRQTRTTNRQIDGASRWNARNSGRSNWAVNVALA